MRINLRKSSTLFLAFGISLFTITTSAQPIWESSTTATGTGNSVVISKPSGTVSGDLLVAGVMFEKGTGVTTLSAPAGWTLLLRTNQVGDIGMQTYYRIADGTDGASFTFTLNNSPKWAAGISRISGVDQVGPIHVSAGGSSGGTASTSVVAPSITTTIPNTLILAFFTNKHQSTYTGVSTERYDVPNTANGLPSNMLASYGQSVAGSTGTKTATSSNSEQWVA